MKNKFSLFKINVERYIDIMLFLGLLVVPFVSSEFKMLTVGRFMVYMIFALSLDILWGSAGLMNLGHAVFLGLGGYIMAICLASQNGIPTFMLMNGITEMPGWVSALTNIPFAFVLAIAVPMLFAVIMGIFMFTGKIRGIFYNVITLAIAALAELLVNNRQNITGGANGIGNLARVNLFGIELSGVNLYYFVLLMLLGCYLFCRWLLSRRFGMVISSIRDNEDRIRFLGFNPGFFKIAIYAIAAGMAGFAGVLYVPVNSFISPERIGASFSTSVLVWVAVGGRGNLTGAMVGALLINVLETLLSNRFGSSWQMVLGIVLIVILMFFPKGIIGTLKEMQYNHRAAKTISNVSSKEHKKLTEKTI